MWAKTILGFLVSLFLSMSLMLNVAYSLPIDRDIYLLIGFIGGVLLWAGIMSYFYCANTLKPIAISFAVFIVSAAINTLFYTQAIS